MARSNLVPVCGVSVLRSWLSLPKKIGGLVANLMTRSAILCFITLKCSTLLDHAGVPSIALTPPRNEFDIPDLDVNMLGQEGFVLFNFRREWGIREAYLMQARSKPPN